MNKIKLNKAKVLFALGASALLCFSACHKQKTIVPQTPEDETFNKQELLVNLADNLVIPSYTTLLNSIDSLKAAITLVKISGSKTDFENVKKYFHLAYNTYQNVSLFGFGPGEDAAIRVNCNTFPADTTKILNNIKSGTADLSIASNISTKGLPALDYLFYAFGSSDSVRMSAFKANAAYAAYVEKITNDLYSRLEIAKNAWVNEYRSTFVNSLSTDVGSSIGYIINQINYELDYLKNSKIATPLGLRSDGIERPNNCEALYSNYSTEFAVATLQSIDDVYSGKSSAGTDGKGFDDYLDHLDIKYGEIMLSAQIRNQFNTCYQKLKDIGSPLSQKVMTDKSKVDVAYRELLKLLVLLKTDLPSNLGVVITYQDGDGD